MFDEREFIARIEAADAEELAHLIADADADEEQALRAHLGDERYQRMREMAEASVATRGAAQAKGNVVVIHGIMGAELSNVSSSSSQELIWLSYWRLAIGRTERLKLDPDGQSSIYKVGATGIMKDYYGEMMLHLRAQGWNVQPFWFDWRKDINDAAASLHKMIEKWFGVDSPVHIVAHSMGGLVARAFIKNHPDRWESMLDKQDNGRRGGRLVMLGTPTYGSFIIPQVVTGIEPIIRKLALLDFTNGLGGVLEIVNTFPGSYQMLPSPFIMENMEPLYRSQTYGKFAVSQLHLLNARNFHEQMRDVTDNERMIYIAGFNRPTFSDILDFKQIGSPNGYDATRRGDGRVTHRLGIPLKSDGKPIQHLYYIESDHAELPRNRTVVSVMDEILERGSTTKLQKSIPSNMRGVGPEEDAAGREEARRQLIMEQEREVRRFSQLAESLKQTHLPTRGAWRGAMRGEAPPDESIPSEERKIRASILQDVATSGQREPPKPVTVEIALVWDFIDQIEGDGAPKVKGKKGIPAPPPPIDAISVGHYAGVGRPLMAEHAIDIAISHALLERQLSADDLQKLLDANNSKIPDAQRLLTLYADRGIVRGELGQPFFIDDPRTTDGRVIVLAGMGVPGRFGAPELTVLARELCWSLGRMGKRHLATVLIGAGAGNLPIEEAVNAWIRGVRRALTGSAHDDAWRLQRITFVEASPERIDKIQEAIKSAIKKELSTSFEQNLNIDYQLLEVDKIVNRAGLTIEEDIAESERMEAMRKLEQLDRHFKPKPHEEAEEPRTPSRITLALEGNKYRFGAVTEAASVPEREVPLDPSLVAEANDELAKNGDQQMQLDWGRYMEKLLVPDDLRVAFQKDAPLLMTLDATTARIHWEMVAQPDIYKTVKRDDDAAADPQTDDNFDFFLGTSRGFTRQLRTTFAPPPEPPPPPRRLLNVLVVADPALDHSLDGAMKEGREVADMFEAFNVVYPNSENRVKVTRLFGAAATRNSVLFHLTQCGPYDILHFSGHCIYDPTDPASSGWIFTGGKRLSANEINRIDNIPKFVFSNACESGITPERSSERNPGLAPSFAESFFARGVSNFVCSAWPVHDSAARAFALKLYSGLLGMSEKTDENSPASAADDDEPMKRYTASTDGPLKMHRAMRDARRAIARSPYGAKTWGAYQHYGNPYLQFFDSQTLDNQTPPEQKKKSARGARQKDADKSEPARKRAAGSGASPKSGKKSSSVKRSSAKKASRRGAKKSRKPDA